MTDLVTRYLQPIASKAAWSISLSREDGEDATAIIAAHLAALAEPTHRRRINPTTGKPISGYNPRPGTKAYSFFYGAAKNKALDILKSRRAAWKREGAVLKGLVDCGAMITLPSQPNAIDLLDNRRNGVKAAVSLRFKCLGLL